MHYRLRGLIICVIVLFIALCIVMATSAKAYDGEPIRVDTVWYASTPYFCRGIPGVA